MRRLCQEGHSVRVLDNGSRGSVDRLREVGSQVELISADIRDPVAVLRAVQGVDAVCHLAFVNGTEHFYSKPELVLEVGVKGIINVLDACLAHDVGELVLASSSEVYQTPPTIPTDESAPLSIPDPLNPRYSYAAGKIISEMLAINYGRTRLERVVIFRPHNVYGPDMGFEHVIPQLALRIRRLAREHPGTIPLPIQGDGRETRAFVYIDDFVDGVRTVMERGDHLGIYHVGTMDEVTIAHLAHSIAGLLDREIELITGAPAPGGTARRCPDIGRLAALGYQPRVSLAEGLRLTVNWYGSVDTAARAG